jgi:hypothetical protein
MWRSMRVGSRMLWGWLDRDVRGCGRDWREALTKNA